MLTTKMENVDGVLYVSLIGRLNTSTAKVFSRQLESELDGAHRVVLDLADLDYISSAGLRVLIAIQVHMENNGGEDVCVRNASGLVLETLEMTGFRGVVNVE